MATIIVGWYQEDDQSFGLNGYAPDFLRQWWIDRLDAGALEGDLENARFTPSAVAELHRKLRLLEQDG